MSFQSNRMTVSEMRDVAFERFGDRIHNTRKIGNNTLRIDLYADRPEQVVESLQHHRTQIVQRRLDGSLILSSGGHFSSTTKERIHGDICRGGEWKLGQKNWEWFVTTPKGKFPFYDGIEFDKEGNLIRTL